MPPRLKIEVVLALSQNRPPNPPLAAWSDIPDRGYLGIVAIYALSGPDGRVRYIGQTQEPKKRLTEHRWLGKSCKSRRETPLSRWLRAMWASELEVTMTVIEWSWEGNAAEMAAIATYRERGCLMLSSSSPNRRSRLGR
jgi:hypothetical protein